MPSAHQREAARHDLIEHFVHLAENASIDTAHGFLARAEETFGDLARQPLMGAPLKLKSPDLASLRKWQVKDFDNDLVFYEPHSGGVSIVRVTASYIPQGSQLRDEVRRFRGQSGTGKSHSVVKQIKSTRRFTVSNSNE